MDTSMPHLFFSALYFAGLLFAEALRLPRRLSRFRNRQDWQPASRSDRYSERVVLGGVIMGIWVLPLVYVLTPWLENYNYQLPVWLSWSAAAIFLVGLMIRWGAQRTLDRSWSFTLETSQEQQLVTRGIFSFTRHPIYLSLSFWAAAQPGLLQNYFAGLSGLAAVLLIWLVRVPREEQLMIEAFGDRYLDYMARTGRFFPK